jgi:REP element-mobilizing transposase RayT
MAAVKRKGIRLCSKTIFYVICQNHGSCSLGNKKQATVSPKGNTVFINRTHKTNAKLKEIYIDRINGYTDHLHCLMALNADMSISKAMNLIKGESAF